MHRPGLACSGKGGSTQQLARDCECWPEGGVHEDSFEFSFQYRCFSLLYSHSTFKGHSSMWESLKCYSEGSPVFGI